MLADSAWSATFKPGERTEDADRAGRAPVTGHAMHPTVAASVWSVRLLATALLLVQATACGGSPAAPDGSGPANTGSIAIPLDHEDTYNLADAPLYGAADAPVTVVFFHGYQCPFSMRVSPTLDELVERYPDQVRIAYKHAPLPFHGQSEPAARAAWAAHQQGLHRPFHEALVNLGTPQEENLRAAAEATGADIERWDADRHSDAAQAAVAADLADFQALGARGTPLIFLNGHPVLGTHPLDRFEALVTDELQAWRNRDRDETPDVAAFLTQRIPLNAAADEDRTRPTAAPAEQPPMARLQVPWQDEPYVGADEPLVVLVLFTSYQCPFCVRHEATLRAVLHRWPDDVRLTVRHNALPFHEGSEPASRAVLAAAELGGFADMHHAVSTLGSALPETSFEEVAKALGLDSEAFREHFADPARLERVDADRALARQLGLTGTPMTLINGHVVRGAIGMDPFIALMEEELDRARALEADGTPRAEVPDMRARQDSDTAQ